VAEVIIRPARPADKVFVADSEMFEVRVWWPEMVATVQWITELTYGADDFNYFEYLLVVQGGKLKAVTYPRQESTKVMTPEITDAYVCYLGTMVVE